MKASNYVNNEVFNVV